MRNLRGRLTLGVLTVLAVLLAVGFVVVAREVDRSERQVVDDRLRRTAELSRATARAAIQEGLPADDRRLNDVLGASGSSLRVSLAGKVLLQSGVALPAGFTAPLGFSTRTVAGRRLRVYTTTVDDAALGGLARVQVTSSLRQLEHRQTRLRHKLLAIGAALLALAGLGVAFTADRLLRPLRRLRAATATIADEDDLQRRVTPEGPAELRALAASFNEMLVRLDRSARERNQALAATRRFAADAGHELRTPLTSVQASLSILARHPELDADRRTSLAEDALTEQHRLVHLLDGLQALARGDANPVAHEPLDLCEIADAALSAARGRHPGVTWEHELPEAAPVTGWAPGLRLIADNLLENAARHGPGDAGGRVRLTVRAAGAGTGPVLVVEDDGPGVAEADRERIFEAFARAGAVDRPGSGLGLALVAQQARHHGATVAVDDSAALGGARFVVQLPA